MVSVIAEWHKNLAYLNMRLLRTPNRSPIANDERAKVTKFRMIVNGVEAENSSFYKLVTVLKRVVLTISLKTPSP